MSTPSGATPLPWDLTPDTLTKSDPTELARRAQENFDALRKVTGAQKRMVVAGTVLTIPNLSVAASVTVNHTLGAAPAAVFTQGATPPFGSYFGTVFVVYNLTATTFDLYGYNHGGYSSGVNVNVYYLATT